MKNDKQRKKKLVPKEFFEYGESLANMNDVEFAEEFVWSEDIIESYIDAVKEGSMDLPSKEELARAVLCLIFSIPDFAKLVNAWNVIHSLASPEIGISLYSIAPQINEILLLAKNNLENIIKNNKKVSNLSSSDDLF